MSLRATFERLRRTHRKALIPFIMGGDPRPTVTASLLLALAEAGADVLEVGIPFSDPLADGPTIQRASQRALHAGTTPAAVLDIVGAVARRTAVPIVVLSYWNPILRYGAGRFVRAACQSGAGGIIVPDLPPEEAGPFRHAAGLAGIATIFLAAPTSPPPRLRSIARAAEGFIYYVSVTGTTGARDRLPGEWLQGVRQLKRLTTKPVCVGFGISTPSQAASVARVADGVIVGSALIRELEGAAPRAAVKRASAFVRRLRKAV
ncbi:MAG: tryptophan synthase subunit alpha [Candidatus Omnitrophica bacterium]|nr:tryptophan synthase subunit alpha [Candidatus Omnitrophota bacterium]